MRCWKVQGGSLLVESPSIPRQGGHTPPDAELKILLALANEQLDITGSTEPIEAVHRYYEVDSEGRIQRCFEESCYSLEDSLYSWAYRVIEHCLWRFWLSNQYGAETEAELELKLELAGLQPASGPTHILSPQGGVLSGEGSS